MSKVVIRQFVLATALVVLYHLLTTYHAFTAHPHFAERAGGLFPALMWQIPWMLRLAVVLAVGVALSLLPDRRGAFRQAILVAGGVSALLILNDLFARNLWQEIGRRQFGTDAAEGPPARFNDTTSALGGTMAHLLGRVRAEDLQPWPPPASSVSALQTIRDPEVIVRMSAVQKYRESLWLAIPLILGGLVVGACTWLRRAATFHRERDERLFRLLLGWVFAFGVVFALSNALGGSLYTLSSPRASLGWLVLPYLVATVPAWFGWRALYRSDQLAAA